MNGSEFSFRLAQVDPGSPEAATLAREIAEDARYPGRAAVANLLGSEEEAAREKGKLLLDGLGTFSLFPLAGSSRLADAATEVWLIRTLTEELAALRQRTGSVLKPLLADRRPFPPPPPGAAPEPVPAPRVCDLVFLLVNRMLHTPVSSSSYLHVSARERDVQIEALRNSTRFQDFFERRA